MTSTNKNVIIITGQSGIKIEESLRKVATSERILNIEAEIKRDILSRQVARDDLDAMLFLLSSPPRLQEKMWDDAFVRVSEQLQRFPADDKPIYLSFHASFYHQHNRGFISPINFAKLYTLRDRVKMVVTLIDDCYDIYRRLLREREMFYDEVMGSSVSKEDAMIRSIWNLLMVLRWREQEIAFSRKLASNLGAVPFFVFAVKHPLVVFERLCSQPLTTLKLYYVAHNISAIRNREDDRRSSFPGILCRFIESSLTDRPDLCLFVPDTIDELRIDTSGEGSYIPRLKPAWPLPIPKGGLLYVPPSDDLKKLKPLNPKDFNYSAMPELQKPISFLLDMLSRIIETQITARDYSLVEQSSSGIVVYHPYFGGAISAGALSEAEYNVKLTDLWQSERRLYIVETPENVGKRRIEFLIQLLRSAIKHNSHEVDMKSQLDSIKDKLLKDETMVTDFYDGAWELDTVRKLVEDELGKEYVFVSTQSPEVQPVFHGGKLLEKRKKLERGWQSVSEQVRDYDPFKEHCRDPDNWYLVASSVGDETARQIFVQHM